MDELERNKIEGQIDPDAFDLLIQGLSVLSSVAGLATTWIQARTIAKDRRSQANQEHLRTQIRDLQRAFEDIFDDLRAALRIMQPAYERKHNVDLGKQKPQYGLRVDLTPEEFGSLNAVWHSLGSKYLQIRNSTFQIQQMLPHTSYPGEENIDESLLDLNGTLNDILFNSATFDDSLAKLRMAQTKAEAFLRALRSFQN